jgi:hypothetical protein
MFTPLGPPTQYSQGSSFFWGSGLTKRKIKGNKIKTVHEVFF